jgi:hypothetical protein
VFFAGLISANKGVGDWCAPSPCCARGGRRCAPKSPGAARWSTSARWPPGWAGDAVHFLGSIPNAEVVARMRAAAVVAVPSHHAYPEGLPLTIYEALSARTAGGVGPSDVCGQSGGWPIRAGAQGGDAAAMAARIGQLLGDPALYAALSAAAPAAWEALQIEAKWGAVIAHWLREDTDWLAAHSAALSARGASTASINAR